MSFICLKLCAAGQLRISGIASIPASDGSVTRYLLRASTYVRLARWSYGP